MKLKFATVIKLVVLAKVIPYFEIRNQNYLTHMWRIRSRSAYIELLACPARAVVGQKVYVENWMSNSLLEWFMMTDEAFYLLFLELYAAKWNQTWAQAAHQQKQQGEQKHGDEEDARYTGRSRGTKCSWSREGLERFNAIMVYVHRDRQANGTAFNLVFKEEMISRYGKTQNESANKGGGQEQ